MSERLADLAAHVAYPPTPELASAVRARLAAEPPRRRAPRWSRRTIVLALVATLLGAGAATAAVPGLRDAVGDLLGLDGATVQRVPRTPPAPATAGRDLGPAVTLAAARRAAGFRLVLAHDARLGAPDAVHLARTAGGQARVTLVYDGGDVTLTQLRGSTATDLVRKLTPPDTAIRDELVGGEPALYVAGSHVVLYRDARGEIVEDRARTAGATLLWQRGPLLLRLEGVGSRRALQIARTVR